MRRNVRCHTHGNSVRPVDQQVGKAAGKYAGLLQRIVEVGVVVYRVFVDIPQHFSRDFAEFRFGITLCRRRVAVHRAEVPLPFYQRTANRKRLRQTYQRVVHGRISVRVIFAQHVADDTRTFSRRFVVGEI